MSCNPDLCRRANRALEKLEVITGLSPILDSDADAAYTMSVLLEVSADYVAELRRLCNTAMQGEGEVSS
jgi:hypothetical protein